jgi:hypothetical protein
MISGTSEKPLNKPVAKETEQKNNPDEAASSSSSSKQESIPFTIEPVLPKQEVVPKIELPG